MWGILLFNCFDYNCVFFVFFKEGLIIFKDVPLCPAPASFSWPDTLSDPGVFFFQFKASSGGLHCMNAYSRDSMWLLKQTEIGISPVILWEVSILSKAGREALHSPAHLPFCPSCIHFGSTPNPWCVRACVCGIEWLVDTFWLSMSECTALGKDRAEMEQGGGSDAVQQWEGDLTKHSIISKCMWKIWKMVANK